MTQLSPRWRRVAALHDIADPGSRGFAVIVDGLPLFGFLVRRGDEVYAYQNVCPHAGRQLNWGPDRFLTKDQSMIMCAAHGAIFDIASGECAAGPCVGDALTRMAVRVVDGHVEVDAVAW
jgi:nitrite reductase/ring-hydroxylating ferredoxin subunit